MSAQVTAMTAGDLGAVLAIQARCYPTIPAESRDAFEVKLAAGGEMCGIARVHGRVAGYLIALPWTLFDPPPLDHCGSLRVRADALYLHDLAIDTWARRRRLGELLVGRSWVAGRAAGLHHSGLIAVQSSRAFWERLGYRAVTAPDSNLGAKLATYGIDAIYMVAEL